MRLRQVINQTMEVEIGQLRDDTGGIRGLGKVEKVYLDNTNLAYLLGTEKLDSHQKSHRARHPVTRPLCVRVAKYAIISAGRMSKIREWMSKIRELMLKIREWSSKICNFCGKINKK